MTYLILFWTFFKIGLFTFGGGYAMIPLIQDAVSSRGWIDSATLVNFIAVSEATPGPLAVNMATYIGSTVGGFFGAVCATLGVVLPSFTVIIIIAKCYAAFKQSRIMNGIMTGLRPAVIGMIASALLEVAQTVFFPEAISLSVIPTYAFLTSLFIFVLMTVLEFKKLHPILIIAISAVLGIFFGYLPDLVSLVG